MRQAEQWLGEGFCACVTEVEECPEGKLVGQERILTPCGMMEFIPILIPHGL